MSESKHDLVSIFEVYQLKREIERRCRQQGIKVEFNEEATTAYSYPGGVTFPELKTPLNREDFNILRGMMIHEAIHHQRNDIFSILLKNKIEPNSKLGSLYNIIEDHVMEHIHCSSYAGDARDLAKLYKIAFTRQLEYLNNLKKKAGEGGLSCDEEVLIQTATVILSYMARAEWDRFASTDLLEEIYSLMPQNVKDLIKDLEKRGWKERLNRGYTPKETFQLAKDLIKDITKKDPTPQDYKDPGNGKGSLTKNPHGDAESDESENEDGKSGSKKNPKSGEGGKQQEGKFTVSWKDVIGHQQIHKTGELDPNIESSIHIDFDGKTHRGQWIPHPESEQTIIDYRGDKGENKILDNSDAQAFANQIRRLILCETRSKFESERKYGKISQRNVHRICLPMRGDGDWNSRIFKRRVDHYALNTCVSVLVDWSGSMSGSKMKVASAAAGKLYEVFGRAIKIPTEILSFSYDSVGPVHAIIKPFNEIAVTSGMIAHRFDKFASRSSGNADADSLLWAYERLSKRSESRHILIVLSDGCPADAKDHGDCDAALLETVDALNKKPHTEVYGIGILDDNVHRYYGSHAKVINSLSELNEALIDTLHNVVIKHRM